MVTASLQQTMVNLTVNEVIVVRWRQQLADIRTVAGDQLVC